MSQIKVPWWNKRTKMERKLVVIVGTFVVVGVTLSAVIMVNDHQDSELRVRTTRDVMDDVHFTRDPRLTTFGRKKHRNSENKFCMSKECITASAELLSNIDETVDPCEDFYNFACGGFIQNKVIPDDKSKYSAFTELSDKLNEQVRGLLGGDIVATEPKPFQMAKSVYQSCMNKELIEKKGLEPVKSILKKLGGWPLLEGIEWKDEGFKWYEQMYNHREHGFSVDYIIDFSVSTDLKNSSWRAMSLDQPGLGMSREYLMKGLEDGDVQAYFTYMKDVALLLGASQEAVDTELLEVIKFEMSIANISLPREERRDATKLYNPRSINELIELDPNTPWLEYINKVLTPEVISVTGDEIIIVNVPSYMEKMSHLIETTPTRVQANYIMWRVAASKMGYLTEEAEKIGLKYAKKLTGQSEKPPRWKKCVGAATGALSQAVGSLYVSKYFDEKSKSTALEMVTEIRKQFNIILENIDWMDDDTKLRAKEKANAMVEHIGYPPELLDMKKLTDLYDGLELDSADFFGNGLNMTVFGTNYAFSKLREKVNKTDWVRHGNPAIVNAFYSPLENSIQFPAGILQGVFFNSERPKYMNYGAIGWVIGHEITHGFDDQGKQFDKEGNLVNWWHPETASRYKNKAQCIIGQYSNYKFSQLDDLHVNGINTQGENIADNGGIKEAYRAYNQWIKTNGVEQLLPGLDYSPRQLFWISAANVWCSKARPQALKLSVLTGAHSPDQFRVQGAFSNMPAFARDFNCPVGSKMNPNKDKQCSVW